MAHALLPHLLMRKLRSPEGKPPAEGHWEQVMVREGFFAALRLTGCTPCTLTSASLTAPQPWKAHSGYLRPPQPQQGPLFSCNHTPALRF